MTKRPILALLAALAACADGSTEPAPAPPDDGGGGGAPGCVDHAAASPCSFQGRGNGCTEQEVCGVAQRACPGGGCCTLGYGCRPAGAARAGGFACLEDADCDAGLCVPLGGAGVCLRACSAESGERGCPTGLTCATVALDATTTVRTCVGEGEGGFDPLRTLCKGDSDCPEARRCTVVDGARFYEGGATAQCLPSTGPTDVGLPCPLPDERPPELPRPSVLSAGCATGICEGSCSINADVCSCTTNDAFPQDCTGELRCTAPCRYDSDCPARFVCGEVEDVLQLPIAPDLRLKFCRLQPGDVPESPCYDELDCCKEGKQPDGGPCCQTQDGICMNEVTPTSHCAVRPWPQGRWVASCAPSLALAPPGGPCADAASCATGICHEGRCAAPCDPGHDRCGTIAPGTGCCGTEVSLVDGAAACVPLCRADCGAAPGCTP